jgi:hypothetical protein
MFRAALLSTVVIVATACSAPTARGRLTPPPGAMGFREIVQLDELQRYHDTSTLMDVLARIRPQMIRPRYGPRGIDPSNEAIDVFIDGHYVGGADELKRILPSRVESVRMVQRSQGYTRYGGLLNGEHALFITLLR